jgi:CBS domain containing-hemolysin-like protein
MIIKEKGVFFHLEESQPEKQDSLLRWLKIRIGLNRRPKQLDIQEVIDEGEERGLIDQEEGDMIEGIFDLKQTVAREIMIPRTHIVSVSRDSALEQVLEKIIQSGYSRIPVYGDNIDHIIGILNAKDLLPLWLNGEKELRIEEIIREPFFVPETKRINDLLNELRTKKSHLAVIVDEYGGTSGIVTIEDIVEEIIGEIRDEHDTEEELFIPQEDGSVIVKALVNLDDFEEYFDLSLPRGGYDTLGGFIIQLEGKVPVKGEEIVFEGLRMKIQGGDQKRITRVLVFPQGNSGKIDASSDHLGTTS